MSVYVDALLACPTSEQWKWDKSCHMLADSPDELHEFAKKIGLKRAWFQNHEDLPHYDLNVSRRLMAVRAGAIEIRREDLVKRMRANRAARATA